MRTMLNAVLNFFKYVLLLVAFGFTLFIVIQMYQRLGKNIFESIRIFIPYLLLLILFVINMVAHQELITKNMFYNITCCLVFSTIILVGVRAILDTNMILNEKLGRGINFNFFDYFIPFMKIMVYGLSISNIFLMFNGKRKKVLVEQVM